MAYTVQTNWHDAMDQCISEGQIYGWSGRLLTHVDLATYNFMVDAFDEPLDGRLNNEFEERYWIGTV